MIWFPSLSSFDGIMLFYPLGAFNKSKNFLEEPFPFIDAAVGEARFLFFGGPCADSSFLLSAKAFHLGASKILEDVQLFKWESVGPSSLTGGGR